jgi:uncharacterized membrane protein
MSKTTILLLGFVLGIAVPTLARAAPEAAKPDIKGLWLVTDYPSITARPGEATTIKLKLQNYNLPSERVALSAADVPDGWNVKFLGGGQPVGAAMAATNDVANLQLRLEVPSNAEASNHTLVLKAEGESARSELPLQISLGSDLPASLSLKPKLPSLRGTAKSSFEYQLTVGNESGKDLLVRLVAEAPVNFQTSFTESYGSQEISSIPIEAGQSKDLRVKVQPPGDIAAGEYRVLARVSTEGASAVAPLSLP